MILIIDNYDSFTYNLVQYIGVINSELTVVRNDKITIQDIEKMQPERIVISPGPGIPQQAGISISLIRRFYKSIPIFGICLGHQSITEAFGGKIICADEIVHGKTSSINHLESKIFNNIPETFIATRYHSLIAERSSFPSDLRITAETDNGIIMGIEHKKYPVFGVQFHPESIMTDYGKNMVSNFLN